jgi:dipeptidase
MTFACLRQDFAHVTAASMREICRSHLEGTILAPRWAPSETFWQTPCLHDTAHSGYHTAASMVAQLRADLPAPLRQVYWANFSNPCCNVFKPFYLHGPTIPSSYSIGTSTYSGDSPWWWANRIRLLCDLNYSVLASTARSLFAQTEHWETERQARVEAEALRLTKAGKEADAATLLQQFSNENCERVEKEYRLLNRTLPETLATVGVNYLYTNYLKEWAAKKGVPLPLP